ncbi:hypothetical protein ALC60_06182 [Trachymyrmex zeteki]|uniref:Uncharacterized protein n=1 Tax=Mycetomoellerius zeteki TaxID=64791 RepID=A0A151X338_9HYME|nr:hypothetical protein ALC60_06182 [Trachymyrmex zeteki]
MNPYMEHVAENGGHYARSPSSPRPFVPQQMALLSASITGGLFSRRGVSREEIRGATRTSDLDGFAESEPTLRAATLVCGRQGSRDRKKKINDRKAVRGEGDAIRLETPRMRTRVRTTRTHTPASEAEKKKRCMQAHTRARARKRERERESSNAISFEPSPASKVRHARKYACGAFRLTERTDSKPRDIVLRG